MPANAAVSSNASSQRWCVEVVRTRDVCSADRSRRGAVTEATERDHAPAARAEGPVAIALPPRRSSSSGCDAAARQATTAAAAAARRRAARRGTSSGGLCWGRSPALATLRPWRRRRWSAARAARRRRPHASPHATSLRPAGGGESVRALPAAALCGGRPTGSAGVLTRPVGCHQQGKAAPLSQPIGHPQGHEGRCSDSPEGCSSAEAITRYGSAPSATHPTAQSTVPKHPEKPWPCSAVRMPIGTMSGGV